MRNTYKIIPVDIWSYDITNIQHKKEKSKHSAGQF